MTWPEVRTETVTLYPHRFYKAMTVAGSVARELCPENMPHALTPERLVDRDEIELVFVSTILGTEEEAYEMRCPETWWDAVKERWMPRWLRRWFPVRWRVVKVTRKGVYPEIPYERRELAAIPVLERWEHGYDDRGQE